MLFLSGFSIYAFDKNSLSINGKVHHIGVEIRPSYILPTHGFYNGWNSQNKPIKTGGSVHLKYSFSFPRNSLYSKSLPSSYQGIGLSLNSFFKHDMLGTPAAIYIFQGVPIFAIGKKATLDYEWNFGLSFGWKASDNDDMVIGSAANAYINVGLFLKYHLNNDWEISAGPEYSHFSNGDTRFPNGGANTINFRIGTTRSFGRNGKEKTIAEMSGIRHNGTVCDITAFGAWRADRMIVDNKLYLINKAFPIAGININPLYRFTSTFSSGISLDLLLDRSANLIAESNDTSLSFSYPSIKEQIAAGISIRGEICMPIFSVNVGIGHNFIHKGNDLKGLYGIFALKTKVSDMFFIHIGYRLSSISYTNNMMFGIGWRIK